MKIQNYLYDPDTSPWLWRLAEHHDLDSMIKLCRQNFEHEILGIFTDDEPWYRYQLAMAITTQQHHQAVTQLTVCVDKHTDKLLCYSWIGRGTKLPYSQEEIAEAKILHPDQQQPAKHRLQQTVQTLLNWQRWASACDIPVIVSSTVRQDQHSFLRIHQQLGYTVRGSIAYKRLL